MIVKVLPLKTNITHLLSIEFGELGIVSCVNDQVTVVLSLNDCENNFGNILQQIHRVIDECYPNRKENVFILIKDESGAFQNVQKIWKSA